MTNLGQNDASKAVRNKHDGSLAQLQHNSVSNMHKNELQEMPQKVNSSYLTSSESLAMMISSKKRGR